MRADANLNAVVGRRDNTAHLDGVVEGAHHD